MGRASIKFNLGDSNMSENQEVPDSEDNKKREERRMRRLWNRSKLITNESLQGNRHASATSITVKSCGNTAVLTDNNPHMVEEIDEDYKEYLDTYASDNDDDSINNVDASDMDVDTGGSSDQDDDWDPQYKMFFKNLTKKGNSYCFSVVVNNQLVDIRYECEEEQEKIGVPVKFHQSLETERGPFNKRPYSDVSGVPKDNCNTESEVNSVDEDFQNFRNSQRIDDDDLVGSELKGKSSSVRNSSQASDQAFDTYQMQCDINEEEGEEGEEEENNHNTEFDEDYLSFLNLMRAEDGLEYVGMGSELKGKSSSVRNSSQASDQAFDTYEVQCDINEEEEDNRNTEFDEDYLSFLNLMRAEDGLEYVGMGSELKRKSSSVRQNPRVSDQVFDTSKMKGDIDEDYQQFLKSAGIVDGKLKDMCDSDVTKTRKGEDGSDSSDSDLILLEPNQISGSTPFISSKIYDSSWFENEANARGSRQFSCYNHSQFRRRLMEDLERPYDQEEYDKFLHEVHHQRQKERHAETRQGVKSYRICGVNKSYLEIYPDLAKAIAEFKEPHKVLFLLRGFIFWLKNMTCDGRFQPWLDESCLKVLRKM